MPTDKKKKDKNVNKENLTDSLKAITRQQKIAQNRTKLEAPVDGSSSLGRKEPRDAHARTIPAHGRPRAAGEGQGGGGPPVPAGEENPIITAIKAEVERFEARYVKIDLDYDFEAPGIRGLDRLLRGASINSDDFAHVIESLDRTVQHAQNLTDLRRITMSLGEEDLSLHFLLIAERMIRNRGEELGISAKTIPSLRQNIAEATKALTSPNVKQKARKGFS